MGHILHRNCLLNRVIQEKVEGTERRGRRRRQLLDDPKGTRMYLKLKEEALDRTQYRNSLWKRLYTCRKTNYVMMMMVMMMMMMMVVVVVVVMTMRKKTLDSSTLHK